MLCAFLLLFFTPRVLAQDERLFRELLLNSEQEKLLRDVKPIYRIQARSNRHFLDLTEDIRNESLFTSKRDGEDWLEIFDHKGEPLLKESLDTHGPWSRLYKIQVRRLNKISKVMILYFYEGVSRYLEFQGTTRIYFISYDNNNLSSLKIYKGPVIWDEKRSFKDHYHQRVYDISFYDLDGDHTREVTVSYGRMNRVYKYLGKGNWYNFDDQEALKQF